MAGLGSASKLGIRKETTPRTALVPTERTPFTSATFTAPRSLISTQTIGGDGMNQSAVAGDSQTTGTITQEFDGETSGNLFWFANGDNGYTADGAFTDGQITTAPGATAGSTGATITAGDYYYTVAAVWTHDFLDELYIMPDSAASTQTTVASGEEVALTWTDPTGLTLADCTYAGTAIYRSTTDGADTTVYFIHYQSGTGASWTDTGADTYADTAVTPVANTTLYEHTFVGAAAASGLDRLDYFTAQMSKNVTSDEQFNGNKFGDWTIDIGGRGDTITVTANAQGNDAVVVAGEFSASAITAKQPALGRNAKIAIDASQDCDIQSVSITLNNNISRQETLCAVNISEGKRDVTGSMTLLFNDRTLYNKAINSEYAQIDLYVRGEPLTNSGASLSVGSHNVTAIPFPRLAKFSIESAAIGEFSNPVDSDDQIIASLNFTSIKGATSSTDLTVKMYNTTDVYDGA